MKRLQDEIFTKEEREREKTAQVIWYGHPSPAGSLFIVESQRMHIHASRWALRIVFWWEWRNMHRSSMQRYGNMMADWFACQLTGRWGSRELSVLCCRLWYRGLKRDNNHCTLLHFFTHPTTNKRMGKIRFVQQLSLSLRSSVKHLDIPKLCGLLISSSSGPAWRSKRHLSSSLETSFHRLHLLENIYPSTRGQALLHKVHSTLWLVRPSSAARLVLSAVVSSTSWVVVNSASFQPICSVPLPLQTWLDNISEAGYEIISSLFLSSPTLFTNPLGTLKNKFSIIWCGVSQR